MSTIQSSEEIQAKCHDLVYQVAYAFYDAPYIILIKLLVQLGVCPEKSLSELVGISVGELRKYMGMLHVHHLVKRHVNKEKIALTESQARFADRGGPSVMDTDGKTPMRIRDVFYWYIDYRDFADVVKYRIAMMRKGIDEKVKEETGVRGYICPNCSREYDPLVVSNLFDMRTNTFMCEDCKIEIIEHDPATKGTGGQEKMQAFNIATQPIRDALKRLEGQTLPSRNIMAWIAQNVKAEIVGDESVDGGDKRFQVVLGGEEKDLLEKERLQEAQRVQNALPVWHTQSTVTGAATALGISSHARQQALQANEHRQGDGDDEDEDDLLEAHYAQMQDGGEDVGEVEKEVVQVSQAPTITATTSLESTPGMESIMVMVNGVPKPIGEIDDDDEAHMTTEEYEAYADAMASA